MDYVLHNGQLYTYQLHAIFIIFSNLLVPYKEILKTAQCFEKLYKHNICMCNT